MSALVGVPGAEAIAGSRPSPVSEIVCVGLAGSLLLTVSVADRLPPSGGLKRIVRSTWFPAPIWNGVAGAPTTEKSPAFGPVIGSEVIVRSQRMHDDSFVIRSVW